MIKVEIHELDGELVIRNGVNKTSGEVLTFREQLGYIYNGGIYPEKVTIPVDKDSAPYPVGFYTIDDSSYGVGNFNAIAIKRLKLIPYPSNQK